MDGVTLAAVRPGTPEWDAVLDAEWPDVHVTEATRDLSLRFRGRIEGSTRLFRGAIYTDEEVDAIRKRAAEIQLALTK